MCIIYVQVVNCQVNDVRVGVNSSFVAGYSIAPNNVNKTGASLNGTVYGFDFGISKQVNGRKEWQRVLGNPTFGLNVLTFLMNKPDTYGFNISVLPWIQVPIVRYHNGEINAKIGIGFAYANKQFNIETNFDNRSVSLPINFAIDFGFVLNQKISKKIDFNAALGYYHLSNGSFKVPNGGIHVYFLKTGLTYFLKEAPNSFTKKSELKLKNKSVYYSAYFSLAYREIGIFSLSKQFPVFTGHHVLYKPINKIYNIGIGLDFFYDASNAWRLNKNLMISNIKEVEKLLFAVGICNEFTFGKLALPFELFTYLNILNEIENRNYLRFGLTYYAYKKVYFGCYFKGNIKENKLIDSDFMEFALGYRFKR